MEGKLAHWMGVSNSGGAIGFFGELEPLEHPLPHHGAHGMETVVLMSPLVSLSPLAAHSSSLSPLVMDLLDSVVSHLWKSMPIADMRHWTHGSLRAH